jgi:hypothetical protein
MTLDADSDTRGRSAEHIGNTLQGHHPEGRVKTGIVDRCDQIIGVFRCVHFRSIVRQDGIAVRVARRLYCQRHEAGREQIFRNAWIAG